MGCAVIIKGMLRHLCQAFILPLRNEDPPIIRDGVSEFIEEVFGNILDLREYSRNMFETMHARQREQGEIISRIGDIFLSAAVEFRSAYSAYIWQMPRAEKRLKEETENNIPLRVFLDVCTYQICHQQSRADPSSLIFKQCFRHPDNLNRTDLHHWLNHPLEHILNYSAALETIRTETAEGNPDVDSLKEVVKVIASLQCTAQLRAFYTALDQGATEELEWHYLVPDYVRYEIGTQEVKRQA